MLNKIILIAILLLALCQHSNAQSLEKTFFITEDLAPYSYIENNVNKGACIEILYAALQALGIKSAPSAIYVYPWARGYKTAQSIPNTCLFPTVRSKNREKLFKWVGPIIEYTFSFISKNEDIVINSIADAGKYRITALREGISHQTLVARKFPLNQLELTSSTDLMLKKLDKGRVDAIFGNRDNIFHRISCSGQNASNYITSYTTSLGPISFAFNLGTDDSIVQKLQHGIDLIRANGTLAAILVKYNILRQN